MFEKFLRKVYFKNWSEADKKIGLLLKDSYKMRYLAEFLITFLIWIPFAEWIAVLILRERTLSGIITSCIILLVYIAFLTFFKNKFRKPIQIFTHLVSSTLYFDKYVIQGNAISKEDFETIKKQDIKLYTYIAQQQCRGACYCVCFHLLKYLKKGELHFTAVKSVGDDKCKNYYTMHVFWVNDDWCFDTYSGKQWQYEYVMKCFQGKTCRIFSYKDVEALNYDQFMEEHNAEIEKWCKENDCEYEL